VLARANILVVDDSVRVREGLVSGINSTPELIVCGEAGNGKEGIEQVERLKPDSVILDISMPVMNGLEGARILRRTHPAVPVIICSSFDGASLRHEAENVGARGIFSKSQPLDDLLNCIRSTLIKPAN
jgi:DNA-binding NarL/FixJ family response regulator